MLISRWLWNSWSKVEESCGVNLLASISPSPRWRVRVHKGRQLAENFIQLSTSLRNHAQGTGESGEKGMEPYWRVHAEWTSVVDDIRREDGFSRFLLSPCFDDLQRAAESGPVIIANRSEYTSDAIIVVHNRPPIHVPLGDSPEDIDQLELWVKRRLRDLWSAIVEPIVAALQNEVQLPKCSRIWWCPTSKLTVLPFHASGPHRQGQENLMDLYVSSYAPSLSALIRTHERARSQRLGRSLLNVVSFAAVGQGQPCATLGLCNLPEVEHEMMRIRDETDKPPSIAFETVTGGAATVEGAVQAFHEHHWVHLACHGAQHPEKPFESWFAMGDGQLTLMRIIRERYARSEFAFLSACHTAQGDRSTPDEVLHLAAGMQFAGFNGVIGTLWRVDDAVAHQVVTRFYRKMFSQPVIDFEYAATALNCAVLESTEVSLEKRIVFVHIGI
ncbi:hypothetical protein JVU11DRAFT_7375 [Chiua virens]|nr:hypothetical protein JVU11DRAFT_7375 [Chiua virens]